MVAPERSCQKIPPCPTKLLPVSSKIDVLLAKMKLIGDGGNASVITSEKKKNIIMQMKLHPENSRVRICERNNSADSRGSAKGGSRGAPG